ncbi:hypothetical protein SLS55_002238 [Diplodia seriata]|uniref:DUF7918 domain-containing protein n=1 Tax=Diplodia seriata TaxID=420778 RepID=A0ABR3CRM7_9PEZI
MANVKGLRVQISHKKEYLATDEEQLDGVITKYIEAGSGQNFSIHWSFENSFPFKDTHIMSSVCLDGKYVDCVAFAPENMSKPEGFTLYGARVMKDEKWYQLPFSFADLKIDEDNHGINDTGLKEKVGSLGEISIHFWRIEKLGEIECNGRMPAFESLNSVPEKALKGRAVSQQALYVKAFSTVFVQHY